MGKRNMFDWHSDEYDRVFKGIRTIGGGKVRRKDHKDHPPTPLLRGRDKEWELSIGTKWAVKDRAKTGEFGLIVNLTGYSIFHNRTHHMPSTFPTLLKYSWRDTLEKGWENEVVIDWPNYGVPSHLPFQFWADLYEQIMRTPKSLMFCEGGHGRTGTAAAILLMVSGVLGNAKDAIQWVRGKYCEEAIEGTTQEQMVYDFGGWLNQKGKEVGDGKVSG